MLTNSTGEYPNTNHINGEAICIHESKWIASAITEHNIQKGDLLFFVNPDTEEMGHTAMIVSTENGQIIYAQHDTDYNDRNLGEYLDTHKDQKDFQYVFVGRIRDDA